MACHATAFIMHNNKLSENTNNFSIQPLTVNTQLTTICTLLLGESCHKEIGESEVRTGMGRETTEDSIIAKRQENLNKRE